jgi:general stress protein 26
LQPRLHMRKELDALYKTIDELDTAMLTTRRRDGHMVSRAMANQKHAPGADLWFVTTQSSGKLDDLANDPHVNLAYYKDGTREWVSVAGLAKISTNRDTIHQLYAADWKIWFPQEGDPRHGTPDDPRMVLIGIDVHSAVYLEVNKPQPVVLYEIAKGWITGTMPDLGEMHKVQKEVGIER